MDSIIVGVERAIILLSVVGIITAIGVYLLYKIIMREYDDSEEDPPDDGLRRKKRT